MKFSVGIIFLTLILQISSEKINGSTNSSDQKDLRGIYCPIKKHPYMVAILRKAIFKFECGGSLLSAKFVLTAAHCIDETLCTKDWYTVLAGANVIIPESKFNIYAQSSDVVKCFKYSKQQNSSNDIAVIKLRTSIVENFHVKYAKLATATDIHKSALEHICQNGTVIGWTNEPEEYRKKTGPMKDEDYLAILHCDYLSVLPWKQCKKIYEPIIEKANAFCAHKIIPGKCYGDSGGPFICNGVQFGVLSQTTSCNFKQPAIFIKVHDYTDVIEKTMRDHLQKSSGSSPEAYFFSYFILFVILF